ncbi:Heterokaryon incompatibility protein 6, OR allele [Colletotrichum sidae]|uniref:Heterokaryon incompatibility protein 6, OR allele n=1 Tax=Colletotrichum sidae TaxID=1347389 RepID=A0A4R8T9B1_9PEZI|nr:Heterokaryon incompatibility protein 6, OR allele [Colletotrichum sidae]
MPQSFWIDAICIDQENDSERGQQVNLMKDIFSAASFVIAWIGEPESQEGLPALFDYLKDLKHTPRNNRGDFLRNSKRRFAFEDARWLVSRPYWSRIWIVQEFTLARELYVLCGPHAISWPSLQQFSPFGMSKTTNLGFKHLSKQESRHSISKHVDSCRELSKLRRSRLVDSKRPSFTDREPDSGARPTLTRLLAFCKDYQCTDPRDRVYGLLGLTELDDEDEDGLRADYSIDAFQLYHRVLSHLGKRGRPPSEMFRFRLAQGLQVADHESFSTSTFVYEAVASRSVKRLLRSGSNIWKSQLLKDVEHHLAINNPEVGRNSGTDSYENVMSYFNCFPREQDPDTWATFEEAMKAVYHLGGNQ